MGLLALEVDGGCVAPELLQHRHHRLDDAWVGGSGGGVVNPAHLVKRSSSGKARHGDTHRPVAKGCYTAEWHNLLGSGLAAHFFVGTMKNDLLLALSALAAEKNLPREVVFEAVEAALTSAFRREGENAPNINVKIDPIGGEIKAYRQMIVVEEVEEPHVEMTMEQAQRWKPDVRIGDVLDFEEQLPPNAGRIAAQTAKQVVLQRLREAERDAVYGRVHRQRRRTADRHHPAR